MILRFLFNDVNFFSLNNIVKIFVEYFQLIFSLAHCKLF